MPAPATIDARLRALLPQVQDALDTIERRDHTTLGADLALDALYAHLRRLQTDLSALSLDAARVPLPAVCCACHSALDAAGHPLPTAYGYCQPCAAQAQSSRPLAIERHITREEFLASPSLADRRLAVIQQAHDALVSTSGPFPGRAERLLSAEIATTGQENRSRR